MKFSNSTPRPSWNILLCNMFLNMLNELHHRQTRLYAAYNKTQQNKTKQHTLFAQIAFTPRISTYETKSKIQESSMLRCHPSRHVHAPFPFPSPIYILRRNKKKKSLAYPLSSLQSLFIWSFSLSLLKFDTSKNIRTLTSVLVPQRRLGMTGP